MTIFNIKSSAFKWYYFATAGATVYLEFYNLFMKQLGLSSRQIGMTSLFGLHLIFAPLLVISCLLPVLPIVVPMPTCFGSDSKSNSSGGLYKYIYCTFTLCVNVGYMYVCV